MPFDFGRNVARPLEGLKRGLPLRALAAEGEAASQCLHRRHGPLSGSEGLSEVQAPSEVEGGGSKATFRCGRGLISCCRGQCKASISSLGPFLPLGTRNGVHTRQPLLYDRPFLRR